jgi:predicted Zn-dependent protease
MKKLFLQLTLLISFFLVSYLLFKEVSWTKLLKVEQTASKTEGKLGDFLWEVMKVEQEVLLDEAKTKLVKKLINHICLSNNIESSKIKLHLINNNEINALALPNNHIIIYTGLLKSCENQHELAGVIGHELAHLENDHIMQKLAKEIGLSVILSAASGNGGGEALKKALEHLSSKAFDRDLETEADLVSVKYLEKAKLNPAKFADFLYRLSLSDSYSKFYWLSTHPASEERASELIESVSISEGEVVDILSEKEWTELTTF